MPLKYKSTPVLIREATRLLAKNMRALRKIQRDLDRCLKCVLSPPPKVN